MDWRERTNVCQAWDTMVKIAEDGFFAYSVWVLVVNAASKESPVPYNLKDKGVKLCDHERKKTWKWTVAGQDWSF